MLRPCQYRLHPNSTQARNLWKFLELGCWLYNTALAQRKRRCINYYR
ncbi:MAG: hypothetical protein DRQ02_13180 [Candidatus Latescibacterota bacterium]|nr:MAG: hypothetical protein DRQ02_13180 [Candidatus Latescibacterota bacterium]